ncbi:MAG TPA: FAD-dependent oxidoreductase [Caldimonas sp.]|jgi:predicted NAD/FAD-binding protein
MKRIAVVGSGIAGLAAARGLARSAQVTLYEAGDHFGGHTHTVDVTLERRTHGVDTGFLVFNERNYPLLTALFAELGIQTAPAEMSFSAQIPAAGIEWSGSGAAGVFAQRSNLLRPTFWNMLAEIARFNRIATRLVREQPTPGRAELDDGVGDFLDAHRFSTAFRDWYFLPMVGSIWSCPTGQMLRFPVAPLLRFCADHGLLQIRGRPQWRSVRGGASTYVDKMLDAIPDARLATPVRQLGRPASGGVDVLTAQGSERYDAVVLACHSDQSLALLADPSDDEREILGAIRWQRNRAVLHSDARVLPERKDAWAAWNYERPRDPEAAAAAVCVHYLLNRLQALPFETPVIVSLNPLYEPASALVQGEFHYAHPVFDRRAIAAQARLSALQGQRGLWYCGAWTGLGFHEDGLASALAVCRALGDDLASPAAAATAPR